MVIYQQSTVGQKSLPLTYLLIKRGFYMKPIDVEKRGKKLRVFVGVALAARKTRYLGHNRDSQRP